MAVADDDSASRDRRDPMRTSVAAPTAPFRAQILPHSQPDVTALLNAILAALWVHAIPLGSGRNAKRGHSLAWNGPWFGRSAFEYR